jgi:hypothetical protein
MAKLKLNNVRLAFPELFEAKSFEGSEPAFSASFLIEPKDKQVAMIEKVMEEVGSDKWGAKWPEVKKQLVKQDKMALHDGDNKDKYAGFAGMLYVSARNKTRPGIFDRDRTPLMPADGKPYGGCYVNCVLDVWAQDNAFGKRINASLSGVQFLRDGEAFSGGRPATEDDFDDIAETSNEPSLV